MTQLRPAVGTMGSYLLTAEDHAYAFYAQITLGDQGVPGTSLRPAALVVGRRGRPSSSPAAISRSAAACSAGLLRASWARSSREQVSAREDRGSGEAERLAVVAQAAGDLAVVEEPGRDLSR